MAGANGVVAGGSEDMATQEAFHGDLARRLQFVADGVNTLSLPPLGLHACLQREASNMALRGGMRAVEPREDLHTPVRFVSVSSEFEEESKPALRKWNEM